MKANQDGIMRLTRIEMDKASRITHKPKERGVEARIEDIENDRVIDDINHRSIWKERGLFYYKLQNLMCI